MPWTMKSQHTSSVSFYRSSFLENTQPFLPGCFDRLSPLPGMLTCHSAISLSISTRDRNQELHKHSKPCLSRKVSWLFLLQHDLQLLISLYFLNPQLRYVLSFIVYSSNQRARSVQLGTLPDIWTSINNHKTNRPARYNLNICKLEPAKNADSQHILSFLLPFGNLVCQLSCYSSSARELAIGRKQLYQSFLEQISASAMITTIHQHRGGGYFHSWDVNGLVKQPSKDKALSSIFTMTTTLANTYDSTKVKAQGSGV